MKKQYVYPSLVAYCVSTEDIVRTSSVIPSDLGKEIMHESWNNLKEIVDNNG